MEKEVVVAYTDAVCVYCSWNSHCLCRIFTYRPVNLSAFLTMRNIWIKWKSFAKRVGHVQAAILFSILYFLLFTPPGLIMRIFINYLSEGDKPYWHKYINRTIDLEEMRKQ